MSTKKLSLAAKVKANWKEGDESRADQFFFREVKKLNASIRANQKNLEMEEFETANRIDILKDALEDAREAVNQAYEDIRPEQVATNALADEFSKKYWGQIEAAERTVKSLEKAIEDATENLKKVKERTELEIAALEARIAKIEDE